MQGKEKEKNGQSGKYPFIAGVILRSIKGWDLTCAVALRCCLSFWEREYESTSLL